MLNEHQERDLCFEEASKALLSVGKIFSILYWAVIISLFYLIFFVYYDRLVVVVTSIFGYDITFLARHLGLSFTYLGPALLVPIAMIFLYYKLKK